jgi:hemerythrin
MSLMKWNDNYSVGILFMDHEHKRLVAMINELYDGIMANHSREVIGKVLDELIDYTKHHFAHEEEYFAKTHYREAVKHKQLHDELARQVLDIQRRYKSGALATITLELMNFLQSWLAKHIQGDDKRYGSYLKTQGIH